MSDSDDESDNPDETSAFTCDDIDDDESDKSLAIKRCYNGGDESDKSLARTATCSSYRDCNLSVSYSLSNTTAAPCRKMETNVFGRSGFQLELGPFSPL